MVVVTRWFGGIKLGAGGLVRAYGGTAAECLRRAERRVIVPQAWLRLECGFEHLGELHAALEAHAASKLEESYDAGGVRVDIQLPAAHLEGLTATLRDATRGQARLRRLDDPPA
jgi:putative IMPACT (imprinted ancient) family translation regulator